MFNTIKVNNTDTNYTHSIFDISDYNSGATYNDLSAALAAVPQEKLHGGMSIKFVTPDTPARYSVVKTENLETEPTGTLLSEAPSVDSGTYDESWLTGVFTTLPSDIGAGNALTYYVAVTVDETTTYTSWVITKVLNSDNKYVQFRYMSSDAATVATFTNTANWQGVDDVPTAGSENLVESGGVSAIIDGSIEVNSDASGVSKYKVTGGKTYKISNLGNANVTVSSRATATGDNHDAITVNANSTADWEPVNDGEYLRYGSACHIVVRDTTTINARLDKLESDVENLPTEIISSADVTPTENSTNIVTSGGVAAALGDTNAKILRKNYYLAKDILTSGKVVTGSVGNVPTVSNASNRWATVDGIAVTAGDIVRFKYSNATTAKSLLLCDSENKVVYLYLGSQYAGKDVRMVVPTGIAKIYITADDASSFYFSKNIEYVDEMQSNILDGFSKKTEYEAETGAINSTNGGDQTATASCRIKIPIPSGAKYVTFETSVYSSNTRGYGFIVNNSWTGGVNTFNKEKLTIPVPAGATEFRTCWVDADYPNGIELSFVVFSQEENGDSIDMQTSWYVKTDLEYGGIDSTGEDIDTEVFVRTLFDCSTMKSIKFMGTTGGTTSYSYAFKVGDSWSATRLTDNTPTEKIINVPNGATECKVVWNGNLTTVKDWWVLATGDIDGDSLVDMNDAAMNSISFQFIPDFDLSHIPMNVPLPETWNSADEDDVYSLYDALVTAYPQYVTKVDADTEYLTASGETLPSWMDGLHTYMYKFSPTRAKDSGNTNDNCTRINVMLTTIHSNEYMGLYSLARMMTHICENWKTDKSAEQCRSLIDFYVFPISCPWCFAHGSRVNYNGVNLNRNFPTKYWELSGSGTTNYSGPTAGSEYEAKLAMYFCNKIRPDFIMDCHTTNVNSIGNLGLVLCVRENQQVIDLASIVARTISNDAIKNNSNFPDNPDYSLYSVYPEKNATGSFGHFYMWGQQQGWGISILTEEAAYSNWENGELKSEYVEEHSDKLYGLQTRYLFNCVLRFVYAICQKKYGVREKYW